MDQEVDVRLPKPSDDERTGSFVRHGIATHRKLAIDHVLPVSMEGMKLKIPRNIS